MQNPFPVTEKHLRNADFHDPRSCPVALAMKDAGYPDPFVTAPMIYWGTPLYPGLQPKPHSARPGEKLNLFITDTLVMDPQDLPTRPFTLERSGNSIDIREE